MDDSGKTYPGGIGSIGLSAAELNPLRSVNNIKKLGDPKPLKALHGQTDTPEDMQKAGQQFEALLLHQMLQSMWQSVPSDGMLSGGRDEELYRDMLNEAIANSVSTGKGIGIREVIAQDIKKMEKMGQ